MTINRVSTSVWTMLVLPPLSLAVLIIGYAIPAGVTPDDPAPTRRSGLRWGRSSSSTTWPSSGCSWSYSGGTARRCATSAGACGRSTRRCCARSAATVYGVLLAGIFVWRRNLVAGTVSHSLYNVLVLLT